MRKAGRACADHYSGGRGVVSSNQEAVHSKGYEIEPDYKVDIACAVFVPAERKLSPLLSSMTTTSATATATRIFHGSRWSSKEWS